MAYSSTNPPNLIDQRISGGQAHWVYSSSHSSTVVAADGFFTDGYNRGMKAGDLLTVYNSTAFTVTSHVILSSASGTTTVVIGDGTTVGSTTNTN